MSKLDLMRIAEVERMINRNLALTSSSTAKNMSFKFSPTINGVKYNMQSSSASIVALPPQQEEQEAKFMVIVRVVNYYLDPETNIIKNGPNYITLNKILYLNAELNTIKEHWAPAIIRPPTTLYDGVEDIRLFRHTDDKVYYLGSYYNIATDKIECVYGEVENPLLDPRFPPRRIQPSSAVSPTPQWEKNWAMFSYSAAAAAANKGPAIIYKWQPLTICQVDQASSTLNLIGTPTQMPPLFGKFRGSTPGITHDNKIWFIVHFHHFNAQNKRKYLHCFVVFDTNMRLLGYSVPFNFRNHSTEFCTGITLMNDADNETNPKFIITYSVMDQTTELVIIPISTISKLLTPVG